MRNKERHLLYPRLSRFKPSEDIRAQGLTRNQAYKLEDFENLEDWFFYTHIDPAQRIIHAIGMILGIIFFIQCVFALFNQQWLGLFAFYLIGVFFYYVSGIISHQFYDAGTGRSHPKYLLPTFLPVIKINTATLNGSYDRRLREFVAKYPFVHEAYDLIEVPYSQRFHFLTSGSIRTTTPK